MFKPVDRSEINQISLTGVRAIVLLGLLMIAPRTFEELKEILVSLNIMEEKHSFDTLRVDMNTLKAFGCEISRADAKTDSKFVLLEHPFTIDINSDDVKLLNKVYKQIRSNIDIKKLLAYDDMFKRIASYIEDEKVKEEMLGVSLLKDFDIEKLKDILNDYEESNIIKLEYKNPSFNSTSIKEIVIEKIEYQNGNILILGYDLYREKITTLNFKRILSILDRRKGYKNFEINGIRVIFRITDFGVDSLNDNEKVLKIYENGYLIEGVYLTEFSMAQRMLSFGEKCTIIEPENCKEIIIKKLKEMRGVYGD